MCHFNGFGATHLKRSNWKWWNGGTPHLGSQINRSHSLGFPWFSQINPCPTCRYPAW